jgi:hypothetical protein
MPGGALAQTGTVSGTVVDSVTFNPLPGANVVVEGTNIGAATESDGGFRLANVPVGEQTLSVSFVGYQQKTQAVQVQENSTNTIRIQLASEAVGVDEVVVTALGVEREERAVSTSVEQVDGADLTQTDNENFVNSLQGKVAGANIRSGNTMGGSSNIVLRGYSSIEGNSQPLIVIDGIVIDNSRPETTAEQAAGGTGFDYGNAASTINPNNIESVSVLKGPSAAALYGSRGPTACFRLPRRTARAKTNWGCRSPQRLPHRMPITFRITRTDTGQDRRRLSRPPSREVTFGSMAPWRRIPTSRSTPWTSRGGRG